MNRLGKKYHAFVVMVTNDWMDLLAGMHFVCITKDYGGFCAHNVYTKTGQGQWVCQKPCPSLYDSVKKIGKHKLAVAVIGI